MSYKSPLNCRRFSLFTLILLICLHGFSQSSFDAVDQLLKQNQKAFGGGYVMLVVKDGKVIYQKQANQDFTAKSPAPIAGAANWMTAALVMTFVDEGKLSLDDKVTQYIPLFGKYMKGYITIRNCLTHTTGIKTDQSVTSVLAKQKFETLEDMVNTYANKHDIATNPGTEFFYSNLGPNIVARVLEVVSKKSFERLIRERITGPLKMRGTNFANQDGGATNPSGGAQSTANDYINFLTMLLNKGTFEGKRILSEKAVEQLETSQLAELPIKYLPRELTGVRFGLGNYISGTNSTGGSAILGCPNLLGTAPFLDKCRGYAAILITEKPAAAIEKKPIYQSLVNLVGEAVGGGCQ
ncbi:serine hydrolase [Puia sp.]|uniref:serine hydrolase domain-containing protein n=1 Tax=Puia sp. TaxID=2045100 RepID=UPI002F40F7D8